MTQLKTFPSAPRVPVGTRVLLIGHALPVALLEAVLLRYGASNYLCVDSLEAADWLMRDGFDAALVVAHARLFDSAEAQARWRARNSRSRLMLLPATCEIHAIERQIGAELEDCAGADEPASAISRDNAAFRRNLSAGHAGLA
ncbi:MAG: hypothetical protein HEQ16_08380 [Bosea sp.]|jgi:hypothetical protein|nr:hypothetical protein [Bosea sp. (in: a-proteobacteria)]